MEIENIKEEDRGSLIVVYVEAVLMPNDKIISNGKQILMANDKNLKFIFKEIKTSEDKDEN